MTPARGQKWQAGTPPGARPLPGYPRREFDHPGAPWAWLALDTSPGCVGVLTVGAVAVGVPAPEEPAPPAPALAYLPGMAP